MYIEYIKKTLIIVITTPMYRELSSFMNLTLKYHWISPFDIHEKKNKHDDVDDDDKFFYLSFLFPWRSFRKKILLNVSELKFIQRYPSWSFRVKIKPWYGFFSSLSISTFCYIFKLFKVWRWLLFQLNCARMILFSNLKYQVVPW